MQDKTQEMMGLVDAYLDTDKKCGSHTYNATTSQARALLESKLRELVREPLSDEKLRSIFDDLWPHGADSGIRKLFTATAFAIERAHGITSASGEV